MKCPDLPFATTIPRWSGTATCGAIAALLVSLCGSAVAQVERGEAREPRVERIVVEDQGTRIEETRVRGQTRRIHVQPKSARGYDIEPADPVRDAAPGPSHGGGSTGKRSWKILSF